MDVKKGWLDVFQFVLFVISGLFVAQFLALVCLLPVYNFKLVQVMQSLNDPLGHPETKMQLLFIQGMTSFIAFILVPFLFIKWKEGSVAYYLYEHRDFNISLILIAGLIMIVSMPFTSILVEWNEKLKLPQAFAGVESWAREKEDFLKEMTLMLTKLNNPAELIIGILVIALIPALGEELVFRGYLQNKFYQITGSPHFAIWLSAFLFSAIHFQFFGFFPRLILGALFGYLYYSTRQFHLPVVGHFINNGLTLILIYCKNKGLINFDIENESAVPPYVAGLSLIFTFGLFVLIWKQLKNPAKEL